MSGKIICHNMSIVVVVADHTANASLDSFAAYKFIQYCSCGWKLAIDTALCKGIRAVISICLCSSFIGTANPLIIEARISSNSDIPWCFPVS